MSSALVCAQPATGNPAAYVLISGSALLQRVSAAGQLSQITPASRLEVRPVPEVVSTGISQIDALIGGLPRGCLTEIYGLPSSGRTSVLLSVIAAATSRQEACALVDVSNAFDPHSAAAAGTHLQQLLWVRCDARTAKVGPSTFDSAQDFAWGYGGGRGRRGDVEKKQIKADMARMTQALKVTDLLVQSGGFGLIVIDLGDLPHGTARRIPLTSWFRFRRAVENTPTLLLVVSQAACARTCASLVLRLEQASIIKHQPPVSSQLSALSFQLSATDLSKITVHNFPNRGKFLYGDAPAHTRLLEGISIRVEVERSRLECKPPQSDKTELEMRTAWGGRI